MEPTFTQLSAADAHPDVQAIIARPPARLTRWGNTVLLLIVAGVLASTCFVRYAERISVPLQLAAGAPAVPVPLAPGAVVGQLCVRPRQLVAQGQLLGYTTDGASVAQVRQLALAQPQPAALPAGTQLGALQASYDALRQLPGGPTAPAAGLQRRALRQRAQQWLASHAVRAPAAGLVSYGAVAALALPARQGPEPSLYILPVVSPGAEVGSVRITQGQLRYLREGQPVEVSFEAYPAGEYGTVRGQLAQIADLPDAQGCYRALVTFPHGLQTTTRQRLRFRAGMNATAELVVAYRPLLQQLFPGLLHSS